MDLYDIHSDNIYIVDQAANGSMDLNYLFVLIATTCSYIGIVICRGKKRFECWFVGGKNHSQSRR